MENYGLSRAAVSECEEIARIVNGAYRGRGSSAGWTSETGLISGSRITAEKILQLTTSEDLQLLVMRDNALDRIVGCICLDTREAESWELGMLSVDPSLQAKGLGKKLLEMTEDHLRQAGVRRATMTVVHVRSELIAWYGRQGYLPTGATEAFPYDDPSVGTPLRDDLHFVVLEKAL